MKDHFLGLNQFVWWFGIVENRLDPLELGRCQVRCFGWHNEDINQIPIDDLPWAHPVVPYGVKAVQPPPEGTLVFGFFADGKAGEYPILMGTVPGVPDEIRDNNLGFTDPYSDEEKAVQDFPRKIKEFAINGDGRGIRVTEDVAKRNPANLNEPTLSRLARPVRGVTESGEYDGIDPESIANTTIDIQRKTRVANVFSSAGYKWDEPYPSYNAMYPFNHVTETESGHAFEMDDTKDFERVQLSHRTGSTLEFLPEGHTKIKSQKSRYDVTMGNHYNYVNGAKHETVDSDMYLKINGKLKIDCQGLEIVSGENATIAAAGDTTLRGGRYLNLGALRSYLTGLDVDITAVNAAKILGGFQSTLQSAGVTSIGGTMLHAEANVMEFLTFLFLTSGIQDFNSNIPAVGTMGPAAAAPTFPSVKYTQSQGIVTPTVAQPPKTNRFSKIDQERGDETTVEPIIIPGTQRELPSFVQSSVDVKLDANTGNVSVSVTLPQNELNEQSDVPLRSRSVTSETTREPPDYSSGDAFAGTDQAQGGGG